MACADYGKMMLGSRSKYYAGLLAEARLGRLTAKQIAKKYQCCRRTIYRYWEKYEADREFKTMVDQIEREVLESHQEKIQRILDLGLDKMAELIEMAEVTKDLYNVTGAVKVLAEYKLALGGVAVNEVDPELFKEIDSQVQQKD